MFFKWDNTSTQNPSGHSINTLNAGSTVHAIEKNKISFPDGLHFVCSFFSNGLMSLIDANFDTGELIIIPSRFQLMHPMEMLVKAWVSLGKKRRCCQQKMKMLYGIGWMNESWWLQRRQWIKQQINWWINDLTWSILKQLRPEMKNSIQNCF